MGVVVTMKSCAARLALACCLWFSLFGGGAAKAADALLHVYVFGAQHCASCQRVGMFARQLEASDGRFKLVDVDIGRSSDEAALYLRVLGDIGLSDPVIPMVVIGPHVLLGYDTDETSGRAISAFIEACVVDRCPDFVAALGANTPAALARRAWRLERRWSSSGRRP